MIRTFPIFVVTGFAALTAWDPGHGMPGVDGTQAQDEWTWQGRVAAGDAIEIKGVNGNIRAMAATGSEVEVVARKQEGRRGDPADVRLEVLEHSGGVTICAVYPDDPDREPNACGAGRHGNISVHDNDTEVHFTVRVPAGVDFVGRTVNGEVEANALGGNVQAFTVNGSVAVEAAGHAEAQTVNGSIRASLGRADWEGPMHFSTVNGSVTVELPDGVGAEVRAGTLNGAIETDFPLTVQGRFMSRKLRGVIGEGGRTLELETVNGTIRLLRRS